MNAIKPLSLLTLSVIVLGCTNAQPLSTQAELADACATVQTTMNSYPDGFKALRGKASNFNMVTLYRAKAEVVDGHCQIWEWANGSSAYVCSEQSRNTEVAQQRQQTAVERMSACLGDDWTMTTEGRDIDGTPAGFATRFQHNADNAPIVSIHIVEDSKGPGTRYSNYLYIGSQAQLESTLH